LGNAGHVTVTKTPTDSDAKILKECLER
jgi:hypothetical protein